MYRCRFFSLHELVPPEVYDRMGEAAWWLLDPRALKTLDDLRDRFGKMTVNNWFWNGNRKYSGFRPSDCGVGAEFSQHKFGRAFDVIFEGASADDVREHVMSNREKFPYITFLELDISWFHFDVRNCDRIKTWSPNE